MSNQADGQENAIHLVGGSKGGSGKSLFTALLAEHCGRVLPSGELSVIDSVPRVGDVFRCYRDEPGVHVRYANVATEGRAQFLEGAAELVVHVVRSRYPWSPSRSLPLRAPGRRAGCFLFRSGRARPTVSEPACGASTKR